MIVFGIVAAVIVGLLVAALIVGQGLVYNCSPNEVLIFSGGTRLEGGKSYGYRLIKGGTGLRLPFLEKVDRLDLSNMVIDVSAVNAYCRGGIPLSLVGVANVKIAGHEPILDNAIERFLGRNRTEIAKIAQQTLEGSLRGILSTMTPEQVNEDKILFAERLVHEVEADMTVLGLVVDTLKIQSVHDDVKYLDSIGRKRSAEVVSQARVAESSAQADSIERQAQNLEQEVRAQILGQTEVARADAQRRLTDAVTRRDALVAEERAIVQAQVAMATAEIDVQKARAEQVRRQLDADVIQPALAAAQAAESKAKADTAPIIESGKARAEALQSLSRAWKAAGPDARAVLMSQKLLPILEAMSNSVAESSIERLTVIGNAANGQSSGAAALVPLFEQLKQVLGVDLVAKLRAIAPPEMLAVPAPQFDMILPPPAP
jgi:flotillin